VTGLNSTSIYLIMFFELPILRRTRRQTAGAMLTWKIGNKVERISHGIARNVAGRTEEKHK
jgi:hypothetical protein